MFNAYNSVVQAMGPHAQANALQGMAQQTMDAWEKENDSRVTQEREERQRQHEKEMEQMRINALLQRLGQQSGGDGTFTRRIGDHTTTWYPDGGFRIQAGRRP